MAPGTVSLTGDRAQGDDSKHWAYSNTSDTEAAFFNLHLSISNDIVSTKIYDKSDEFDFESVNFLYLDGDVPRSTSTSVSLNSFVLLEHLVLLLHFNIRNKLLTQKLLKQGYRFHKLHNFFSKFYRRNYDLMSKFQVGQTSLAPRTLET